MAELDDIIHQPLRLKIMAALNALPAGAGLEFSRLKKLTGATDGNLGAHIETLSKAGYVAVDKAFVGKKPQTTVTATAAGRGAFARHVATLQEIIAASARQAVALQSLDHSGAPMSRWRAARNDGIDYLPLQREGDSCDRLASTTLIWLHLMNILLLGSGGREHALAWKIAASPLVTKLWCAPGNAGIAREAECVALDITDHAAVIDFCKRNAVDFVVVGPDAPIAAGIVDDLNAAGFKAFGPTKAAGQLESSKSFTKALCQRQQHSDRGLSALHRCRGGESLYPPARRADRGQGRRSRRRQGRRRRDDASRKRSDADRHDVRRRVRRGRRRGRGRGIHARRGGLVLCAVRRRDTRCRWPPRRITSAPSMATRVRTPAAWAPIRRRPS